MVDVVLVYPPDWEPFYPYLAVPSLTAYLNQQGFHVVQMDANVQFYDRLLTQKYLETSLKALDEKIEHVKRTTNDSRVLKKLDFYLSIGDIVCSRTEKVKEQIKKLNPRYWDEQFRFLQLALNVVSCVYSPTHITLRGCSMRYSSDSKQDIMIGVADREQNPFLEFYETSVVPEILSHHPSLVGISITGSTQTIPGLTLAYLLKQYDNDIHICVGGNRLFVFPELFQLLDSVVIYEGEHAFAELTEEVLKSSHLEKVPNLIYYPNGHIKKSEGTATEDVDKLPTPDFSGLPLEKYFAPVLFLPLLTSRGCYWGDCAFCTISFGYGRRFKYKPRSIEKVLEDIVRLVEKYNTRFIQFADNCIHPRRAEKLCDGLIEEDLHVRWMMEARLEHEFTPEVCRKLYRAGCRLMAFGLESGCQRILDLMNKGITKERISQTLGNSSSSHIWNHVCLIVGFPTETREEAGETLEFLKKNREYIGSAVASKFLLELDSKICNNPEKYGVSNVVRDKDKDFQFMFDYDTCEGMNKEEIQKVCNEFQDAIRKEGLLPIEYGGFLLPLLDGYEKSGEELHVSE